MSRVARELVKTWSRHGPNMEESCKGVGQDLVKTWSKHGRDLKETKSKVSGRHHFKCIMG